MTLHGPVGVNPQAAGPVLPHAQFHAGPGLRQPLPKPATGLCAETLETSHRARWNEPKASLTVESVERHGVGCSGPLGRLGEAAYDLRHTEVSGPEWLRARSDVGRCLSVGGTDSRMSRVERQPCAWALRRNDAMDHPFGEPGAVPKLEGRARARARARNSGTRRSVCNLPCPNRSEKWTRPVRS